MALEKIIAALENLEGPDRKVDQDIALQVGYRLSINQGLLTGERDRKDWWLGDPPKEVSLPAFTKSIDKAIELAKLVDPDYAGNITLDGKIWRAQLNDDPPCEAPTAAIAMCIAAMRKLRKNQ